MGSATGLFRGAGEHPLQLAFDPEAMAALEFVGLIDPQAVEEHGGCGGEAKTQQR